MPNKLIKNKINKSTKKLNIINNFYLNAIEKTWEIKINKEYFNEALKQKASYILHDCFLK